MSRKARIASSGLCQRSGLSLPIARRPTLTCYVGAMFPSRGQAATPLSFPLCWKLPPSVQWRVQPPVSSLAVSGHQLVVATVGALMTRVSSLNQ